VLFSFVFPLIIHSGVIGVPTSSATQGEFCACFQGHRIGANSVHHGLCQAHYADEKQCKVATTPTTTQAIPIFERPRGVELNSPSSSEELSPKRSGTRDVSNTR